MPRSALCCVLLLAVTASPGLAQAIGAAPRARPEYRLWTAPMPAPSDDLVAALDVGSGLQLGVGRVRVFDPARPRTHVEAEPRPMDVRRRERNIAALRLSFSF